MNEAAVLHEDSRKSAALERALKDPRVAERFWGKTRPEPNTGCWLWCAGQYPSGYGSFWLCGRDYAASRVALALHMGKMPSGQVLHSCDTPACCNPAHLREGSHAQNMRDRNQRNRQARGSVFPWTKLSAEKVREIRRAYAANEATQYELADRYKVKQPTIEKVLNGKTWRHVA